MPLSRSSWTDDVALIDYRGLAWERVTRTRFFCYQRFHYSYPGPIMHLHQRLMVVPPDQAGNQTLVDQMMTSAPHPADARQREDAWGNRVWELYVDRITHEIAFESVIVVERTSAVVPRIVAAADAQPFLEPTRLTTPDDHIRHIATTLTADTVGEALADRISAWVADAMAYESGATTVRTTAAQALAIGKGLCQDYAHLMIAICRAAGLPARYVSGHMLADGGSHAWVEVLVPDSAGSYRAVQYDPTNRRRPNMSYTEIAVGRDYSDVAPAAGSFSGSYAGRLQFSKRGGLVLVEYNNGDVVETYDPLRAAPRRRIAS